MLKIIKKLILNILIIIILMKYSTIYNSLFIKGKYRFGNFFLSINNAIIYCEILGCKKISYFSNKTI